MAKGIFLYRVDSIYDDEPDKFYRFPRVYLSRAREFVGDWVIYMEPVKAGTRGYHAVAKVQQIIVDPANSSMYLALIEPGTYLPLGKDVPFRVGGTVVEQGVLNNAGNISGRAQAAVRPVSEADFNRIIDLGLVDDDELLPREDEHQPTDALVREDQAAWQGPIDRTIALVSRKVRDRQFRKRVLDVYDRRCALTGMQLINGGGRAEAQAAHIMSVEAGGPDVVANGLALSGTVHWMFDRGLISLSDSGDILLSNKINDIEGVEKLIYTDRKARLPASATHRPHPRYLQWHRDVCFHG
ncbi:MAG TPA: HNH endonuclease [Sphingomicrobium sp.]|nr:HNH endonuclease [Sphingomicrobium sp.]